MIKIIYTQSNKRLFDENEVHRSESHTFVKFKPGIHISVSCFLLTRSINSISKCKVLFHNSWIAFLLEFWLTNTEIIFWRMIPDDKKSKWSLYFFLCCFLLDHFNRLHIFWTVHSLWQKKIFNCSLNSKHF